MGILETLCPRSIRSQAILQPAGAAALASQQQLQPTFQRAELAAISMVQLCCVSGGFEYSMQCCSRPAQHYLASGLPSGMELLLSNPLPPCASPLY